MSEYFTAEYQWLWTLVLALALFIPVRNLINTLAIRRAIKKGETIDEAAHIAIKKRASVTSILLCFVFSYLYTLSFF